MDSNKQKPEVRQLNIELMRIFSMFLIVLGHVHVHYLDDRNIGGSLTSSVLSYLFPFIVFHVNLFVLISGYFGIKNPKRAFFRLLSTLLFYSIVISSVLALSGYSIDIISTLLPFSHGNWWFIQIYACMLPFAPLIENVVKYDRRYFYSFLIFLILIDVYLSFIWHMDSMHNHGCDIVHFLTIYSIGVLLRNEISYIKNIEHYRYKLLCIMLLGVVVQYKMMGIDLHINIYDYNNPYSIIMAICVFCLFESLVVYNYYRWIIMFFSSSILSVYIVTEHTQIRILLTEFFTTYILPQAFSYKCLATIMIFVICTFIFCCSVDKVRIWVFKYIERLMPILRKRI